MIEAVDSAQSSSVADFTSAHSHTALPSNLSTRAAATNAKSTDSVALSVVARAKILEQQGKTIGEIAQSLEIPANTVLQDLGLANASLQALAASSGSRA